MRKLASIQIIKSLSPIPNADAIEKAEVLGWELVVKKGDFKVGDKVIYCEIDSVLPEYPCFEFLRSKKFRIKTIKLKSQISQGIAFPLSTLTEMDPSYPINKVNVDDDVTEVLKITKYDPESVLDVEPEEQVKKSWLSKKISYYKWKLFGLKPIKKGLFPSDIPKTDETRVQNMGSSLNRFLDQEVYITEKLEGTSATFVYRKNGNWLAKLFGQDGTFQVCSRNRIVYNSQNGSNKPEHHLMSVAEKYDIHNQLKKLNRNLAIQGEVFGPKIQGNIYKSPELELRVFLIFDIDNQKYLNFHEMKSVLDQLELSMVPVVGFDKIKDNVKYYVDLSKGKSEINPKVLREGIVVRTVMDELSFKSINPEYLLKQD